MDVVANQPLLPGRGVMLEPFLQAGAVGVAVITAVISAEDIVAATRKLALITTH